MLAKSNRITASKDFSAVVRRGARAGSPTVVCSVLLSAGDPEQAAAPESPAQWRCGFIVSKAVGNAVVRHRTTRRLRHIVRDLISSGSIILPQTGSMQIVIRALAHAAEVDHPALQADVGSAVRRAMAKAQGGSTDGSP